MHLFHFSIMRRSKELTASQTAASQPVLHRSLVEVTKRVDTIPSSAKLVATLLHEFYIRTNFSVQVGRACSLHTVLRVSPSQTAWLKL